METIDASECPEWELATHPAPGLPVGAPATPAILWEWSPLDDPMLAGLGPGVLGYQLRRFSIGASGDVWLIGPTETDVTAVGRDGRALFHARLDDPTAHRIALGSPVAAPDGTVFIAGAGTSAFVVQVGTGGLVGRLEIPSAMGGGVLPMIGPHGRVHMGGEHCRLRPMRRFQFEQRRLRDGAIENRGFGAGRVEAAGAVIGVGFEVASRPAYEIDGTLGWRYGVEPELVQPDFAVGGVWTAAGHELIGFGVYGESGYTHRLLRGSETLYEESNPPAPQSAPALMLDATGAIWRFDTDAGTMRRVGHWPDRPAPCLPHMDYRNFAFAEDGTLICISLTTWRLLALSPTDGSVLWELAADPGDPEAGFFGIVGPDLDGRIYLAMQRSSTPGDAPHLVAVQTDLRPPGDHFCGGGGCNRHLNSWAHDYRPVSAGP